MVYQKKTFYGCKVSPLIFYFLDVASNWCFDIWVHTSNIRSIECNTNILFKSSALADKYGRRWPLMIDIVLFSVINMASGFAPNLQTFIALRALFGIAMGGEWVRKQNIGKM